MAEKRSSGTGGKGGDGTRSWWWVAPALYAVATAMLFRAFLVSGDMLFGSDTLSLGYAARHFYAEAVRSLHIFPLWNPYILGGTPFIESTIGGDAFYPTTVLKFFMDVHRALGWKLILHVFVSGLFTYGWVRSLDLSRAAALLSGLAYLLAPFMVTLVYPGHDGKLFVTALTPLLFWMAEWSLKDRGWLPFAALGLVVTLVLLTPHFQAAYFLFGSVGAYYVFHAVRIWRSEGAPRKAGRLFGLFMAASVLGAGAASIQVIPPLHYVGEHSRRTATTTRAQGETGVAYSSSWSLHPEEVVGLVVPEFAGSDVGREGWAGNTYWGRNPFKLNHEYAGILVLLLAPVGFLAWRRRRGTRWFFAGLGTVALLYALGAHTPVWRVFYEVVPGISLFRAPSITAFVFGFSAITLFAFGVDRAVEAAFRGSGEERGLVRRYLWGAMGVLGFLAILAQVGILLDVWTSVVYRDAAGGGAGALERARPFIVRGFWIATFLCAAAAGAWEAAAREVAPKNLALGALGVLLAIDLLRVDLPFIQVVDPGRYFSADATIRRLGELRREGGPFRVLSLAEGAQDVKPSIFGIELAAGHHPNDLARYRELIGMRGSGIPENLVRGAGAEHVRSILNVRYAIDRGQIAARRGGAAAMSGREYTAYRLGDPLPRAYLVGRATVVPDSGAVDHILSDAFEPAREVVLPEAPPVELDGGPVSGQARWVRRGINRMTLEVTSDRNALLVIGDNYFPAWRAEVDGEPARVLRANHALRAIPVGPGEHTVELWYESSLLKGALAASLLSLLALVGTGAASWWRRRDRGPGGGG